jgi:hypothetical protein
MGFIGASWPDNICNTANNLHGLNDLHKVDRHDLAILIFIGLQELNHHRELATK